MIAGGFSDLQMYSLEDISWTRLSDVAEGNPPVPRYAFGFASAAGKIYAHGGHGDLGKS